MSDRLDDLLEGSLGYFWDVTDRMPDFEQDDPAHGFIRYRDGGIELRVLADTLDTHLGSDSDGPEAFLGVTEHTGVLVLDIAGLGSTTSIGGSRASVERVTAQTVIADGNVVNLTTHKIEDASLYFHGSAFLNWAGMEPLERKVEFDSSRRVKGARIELRSIEEKSAQLPGGRRLWIAAHWNVMERQEEGHLVETALEVGVGATRATDLRRLLLPLGGAQELLSLAFGGFVKSRGGRARCEGAEERGQLWNSVLHRQIAPPGTEPLTSFPMFSLEDIGGAGAFRRWARLSTEHQRAVSPLINRVRRGRTTWDLQLLEIAAALEYWVAAHRRTSNWTKRGENHAEAVALKVGEPFASWCGNTAGWASEFWRHYNGLKHDPAFRPDPHEVRVLAESGYLLLMAEVLDRIAGSKRPARKVFGFHGHWQLKEWTQALVGSS